MSQLESATVAPFQTTTSSEIDMPKPVPAPSPVSVDTEDFGTMNDPQPVTRSTMDTAVANTTAPDINSWTPLPFTIKIVPQN